MEQTHRETKGKTHKEKVPSKGMHTEGEKTTERFKSTIETASKSVDGSATSKHRKGNSNGRRAYDGKHVTTARGEN